MRIRRRHDKRERALCRRRACCSAWVPATDQGTPWQAPAGTTAFPSSFRRKPESHLLLGPGFRRDDGRYGCCRDDGRYDFCRDDCR